MMESWLIESQHSQCAGEYASLAKNTLQIIPLILRSLTKLLSKKILLSFKFSKDLIE